MRKVDLNKSSTYFAPPTRKVTRSNLDSKAILTVFDLEILLRRSKNFQDRVASSSKGKHIHQRSISFVEKKYSQISKEELI